MRACRRTRPASRHALRRIERPAVAPRRDAAAGTARPRHRIAPHFDAQHGQLLRLQAAAADRRNTGSDQRAASCGMASEHVADDWRPEISGAQCMAPHRICQCFNAGRCRTLGKARLRPGALSQPCNTGCGLVKMLAHRLNAGRESAGEAIAMADHGQEHFCQIQRLTPSFTINRSRQ